MQRNRGFIGCAWDAFDDDIFQRTLSGRSGCGQGINAGECQIIVLNVGRNPFWCRELIRNTEILLVTNNSSLVSVSE
jgi:hypothetical protein